MPEPNGRYRPTPEELAKRIAARLAEKGEPDRVGFSLRDSVLVARLLSGLMILTTAGVLVLGVYAGVDLLRDHPSPDPPEVLSVEMTQGSTADTTMPATTVRLEDFIGIFGSATVSTNGHGPVASPVPSVGTGVPMPAPSTTSTSTPGSVGPSTTVSTTNPLQVTTTQPSTTSTTGGSSTTTSTTMIPRPTIPPTTTTITVPTIPTTTTLLPTTTTEVTTTTTTTVRDTTTTCANRGQGHGNC